MTSAAITPPRPLPGAFYRLAGTELWERFSLHGMKALLTLYLVEHVLVDGRAAPWGLAALKLWLEGAWGTLTPLAFASQLYGLYAALTYFVLPIGGLLGDRVMGRRQAVILGAVTIAAGHACLTIPGLLVPALLLLILGTGLLKANLAAQVGDLFQPDDPQRGAAFARYLIFLNIGVMLGPLICGWLAQSIGWEYGFGAAGIAMLAGLAIYIGMPGFAEPVLKIGNGIRPVRTGKPPSIGIAATAILIVVLGFSAYEQISNIFLVWIQRNIELSVAGFAVPPAWFVAADGLLTIMMVFASTKIGVLSRLCHGDRLLSGCAAIMVGYALLAVLSWADVRSIAAPVAVLGFLSLGIALIWPAGLAIVTAAAPGRLAGTMVGLFYLHGFFANLVVGSVGALYERMPVPLFWALHVGIAGLGFLLALPVRRKVNGAT